MAVLVEGGIGVVAIGHGGSDRDTFLWMVTPVQAPTPPIAIVGFGTEMATSDMTFVHPAEHQLTFVRHLRLVADGEIAPEEAVRAYHADLGRLGIRPHRPLGDDLTRTDAASAYSGSSGPGAARRSPAGPLPASSPAAPSDEPDFSKMSPAEKARWNLERWKRIVG